MLAAGQGGCSQTEMRGGCRKSAEKSIAGTTAVKDIYVIKKGASGTACGYGNRGLRMDEREGRAELCSKTSLHPIVE